MFTSLAFKIQDLAVRPYVATALHSLQSTNDPAAQKLADVIRKTFHGQPDQREYRHIEAIETIRRELNESNERITIVDYGAKADSVHGSVVHKSVGDVALSSSKPYRWSLLLLHMIRSFAPERCLEFGTCLGISTLYQAAALTINRSGTIVTMEGAESLAAIAQKNFSLLGYENIVSRIGKFDDILPGIVRDNGPFDYVFIDGHHEEQATVNYFTSLVPFLKNGAVILFDDIHWSSGMKRAWRTITQHTIVNHFVDLYQIGIIITQ